MHAYKEHSYPQASEPHIFNTVVSAVLCVISSLWPTQWITQLSR
jgi:hypothetical protein